MNHALVFVAVAVAGILVGVFGHAMLQRAEAASRTELVSWSGRLRSALASDIDTAKSTAMTVITEIERKLG